MSRHWRDLSRPSGETPCESVTDAPNAMWATDGPQITTVRDGKVWLFATVEHWNAEALGWHVSKPGTRHEAVRAFIARYNAEGLLEKNRYLSPHGPPPPAQTCCHAHGGLT